jgi:hypothetical protein
MCCFSCLLLAEVIFMQWILTTFLYF